MSRWCVMVSDVRCESDDPSPNLIVDLGQSQPISYRLFPRIIGSTIYLQKNYKKSISKIKINIIIISIYKMCTCMKISKNQISV